LKISFIVVMVISFHQFIDDAIGMLMALCSEVEIDHGGVQAVMAQILLDATDVDPGFQQMSSIAVPEGMNGDTFCEFKLFKYASQRTLHRGIAHGFLGGWPLIAAAAESWKDPKRVAMAFPVMTQHDKRSRGQRNIAIFGTFAAMHVDAHPFFVNVRHLKVQGFMQSEATGVNGGKIGFVLWCSNPIDDGPNFVDAQYGGQSLFPFGIDELQSVPITL